MIVPKSSRIDLNSPRKEVIHLTQDDNTRQAKVMLYADGRPYDVTADTDGATVQMAVAYILPNGYGDQYTQTELGEPAVVQDSSIKNLYTINIDGPVTDKVGFVELLIKFTTEAGQILHSFPLTLNVKRSRGSDVDPDGTPTAQSRYLRADLQTPATEEMTQPVGITPEGLLVTTPGGGGGGGSGTVNPVGMGFAYSTSSTAQATSPKTTGTVSGFALKQYAIVVVRFSNPVNSGQKLNFSGTGAKDIYFRNSAIGPGIIEAGDTVTFQYDGNRYRIISIDKAPVSQTDDSNYFVHLTASPGGGGDMLTDRTASDIYTALSANTDLNFILIDGNGRQAHFTKKPTSANDSAQFTLVANGNQITYTLPTNGGNTVTIATESIIGGGGTATWESILPAGGIRQTDIAKLIVTFTQQGNGYTASSNLTQVLAALNDNKAVECRLGDHIGDLVYVHEDSEDTSASFAIFRMTGMIAAFQNQENEERFPAILMLYMTHVGVSYKEFAIGGACYCYVTESGGVYDIDQANTSLAAQTIPGLLTAYYAGIETQMVVYDGYQRWNYPVISHYGQAEIVFGGLEQVIENGNVVSYLVSYTFSAQNAHIIRNRRRAAGGMDVPAPGTGDNGKVWMAGANGTASWQTPSGGGSSGPAIPAPAAGDNGKYLGVVNGAYALVNAPSGSGATIYGVTAVYRSGYWYIQHDNTDIAAEDIFTALGSGALIRFVDDAGAEGDLLEISYDAPGNGRILYKTSNVDNGAPGWRLFEIVDTIVQGNPRANVAMTPVELLPVSDSRTAATIASGFTVEGNRVYTVSGTIGGFTLITSTRPTMLPGQCIEIRLTVGSTAITTPTWPSWAKFLGGWDGKFEANTFYKILIDDVGNVMRGTREVST